MSNPSIGRLQEYNMEQEGFSRTYMSCLAKQRQIEVTGLAS